MEKTGRNDPCPCGSGKKFKKCCETKMIGKKFMASKIEKSPGALSSFFKDKVASSFPLSKREIKVVKSEEKKPSDEKIS